MPIPVTCSSCGYQTVLKDSAAGKAGKCPQCGGVIQVPAAPLTVVEAELVESPGFDFGAQLSSDPIPVAPSSDPAAAPSSPPDRLPCKACGEMIASTALKCRFCGEIFDPQMKKEAAKQARRSGRLSGDDGEDMSTGDWVAALLCSGIGCIAGVVWLIQGKPKGKKMFLVSICMVVFWNVLLQLLKLVKP